jgi:ERCC4-type nuclease
VDILGDLKVDGDEPDPETAQRVGVDKLDEIAQQTNFLPCDLLERIPTVSAKNKQFFIRRALSLHQMSLLTEQELTGINGNQEHARTIWQFFNHRHSTSSRRGQRNPYNFK